MTGKLFSVTLQLVKSSINTKIVLTLVIGLLLGYIIYPFINRESRKKTSQQTPTTTKLSDWRTFSDKQYEISFNYPTSWSENRQTQIFEGGDLVAVEIFGETKEQNTEFYDGGRFIVMVPLTTADDLDTWVKNQTTVNDKISDTTINGRVFKKVYTCGLGCYTYYYALSDGKIYGINIFTEGSKKAEYQAVIDQMFKTLTLPK